MKKRYLLLLMIAGIGFTLSAQEEEIVKENWFDRGGGVSVGFKAGANLSGVRSESSNFDADSRYGFAGGVFVGIPLGKYIGLQPEMIFSQKGFESTGMIFGSAYALNRQTSFIDMPMQFQFKPFPFLTVVAGPQLSFLLLENNVYMLGGGYEQKAAFDSDNTRYCFLGAVAGVDFNIRHLVISGRAGWDFQDNRKASRFGTPLYRNQFVQVTLGFRL